MKDSIMIDSHNLWKRFRLYHERNYNLKEVILRRQRANYEEFWALKDVSFQVKKGETLGVIGENGSGKSTLLKVISRILRPDKGKINVRGRVSALLELGAGFHPELTGRENIYLNGSILGFTKREINEKFEEIVDFAELEQFIDTPVKNYSSGMYMRLGFAIAINVDPDVLLVDEVLAVGDQSFQGKCFQKINEFKRKGKTILFVSHDLDTVNRFCDRVLLLNGGRVLAEGKADNVIQTYRELVEKKEEQRKREESEEVVGSGERFGSKEAEILSVKLINTKDKKISTVKPGEKVRIQVEVRFNAKVGNPIVGMVIRSEDGLYLYDTNTLWQRIDLGSFKKGDLLRVNFVQNMQLLGGNYFLTTAVAYADATRYCDWWTNALSFRVRDEAKSHGRVNLDSSITFDMVGKAEKTSRLGTGK